MYKFLASRIAKLKNSPIDYAEPFCGGAGSAVILLKLNVVEKIHLNDADVKVYSSWISMLEQPERFIDKIMSTPVDLENWHKSRHIVETVKECCFELGFATFYLNRTCRSGIVIGAGPIGGYDQKGKWKVDARFNRDALCERIAWLNSVKDRIVLTNEDALTFIHKSARRLPVERMFFFVDPPYVTAGGRLYLNAMDEGKHIALSDMLQSGMLPNWVLTYDDHPLIRSIYQEKVIDNLSVTYSLQNKRKESEILICDHAVLE